jgi:phage gpG-like protein
MNILEFTKKFYVISTMTDDFINNLAPRIAGNVAVRHFKDNFQNQGFEGQKWQEVKRRISGTTAYKYNSIHHPARTSRMILTGDTGDLGRSIQDKKSIHYSTRSCTIISNLPYAAVHNEGLHAGRGRGFTMPRRQFMGDSDSLDKDIQQELQKQFENIFNH